MGRKRRHDPPYFGALTYYGELEPPGESAKTEKSMRF